MPEDINPERFSPIQWLFREQVAGTLIETIAWWELRRIPYNLIVGALGLICLFVYYAAIEGSGHLQPGEDAVEPIMLIVTPVLVNVCYTGGWIVEVIGRLSGTIDSVHFSPRLLKLGIGISFIIVSLPAVFWLSVYIFHWLAVG